jgi:hypothetical protein
LYEGTRVTQNVKTPRTSSLITSRALAALALTLTLGGLLAAAGCSSTCEGDDCHACADRDCAEGQRCVQNACRDACTSDDDCQKPQTCEPWQFKPGDRGNYCAVRPGAGGGEPGGGGADSGGAGGGTSSGRFEPCDDSSECDEAHGFACVEGECTYECESHADCIEVGHCSARSVDGARKTFCVRDAAPPEPGTVYTPCPTGDECAGGALCLGAGEGDLDAYCSVDCSGDDDCRTGYYCGVITRAPCEDACDFRGQPSDPSCVPVDQIGDGKPYRCSENGIERSVCRQREFCSPCETDDDCLGVPNQVCAKDASGAKICTRLCDTGARSCPWGNAATCGVFDEELGVATCSHRFGSCHGTGQTCEPCRGPEDCPSGICASSQFTGERWCINLTTRCSCEKVSANGTCSNGGCPDSPSGLGVLCIGEETSSLFNTCYAANSGSGALGASPQTGCWGPE